MHKTITGEGHVSSDPPSKDLEEKPAFLSARWWVLTLQALAFWKYSAKDWAIWNLSSYATYGMVFGVFKPVATFIGAKAPWLLPMLKLAWAKVTALVIAIFHVSSP